MLFKHWSKWIILATVVLFFLIAIFNYLINPYSIFHHDFFAKNLHNKNHSVSTRMHVFYTAVKYKPDNIMIGSSRIGTFPRSDLKKYLKGKTYNMAMPGSNVEEQSKYIQYMIKNGGLKNIIWGLDFYAFNPNLPNDPSFSYNRVDSSVLFKDDYKVALFSFQTTKNSYKTLVDNIKNPSLESLDKIETDEKKKKENNTKYLHFNKEEIDKKTNDLLTAYPKKYFQSKNFIKPHSIDNNLHKIKKIISLCKEKNINIYIYTSPVQSSFLDLYSNLGLENTFNYWKEGLAKVTTYTDFATYNTITNYKYNFIDGSHIMPDYGKLIFAKIFHDTSITTPKDFGEYR